MNPRERFWQTMRFDTSAGIPFWADWLGPWQRWQKEGLPVDPSKGEEFLRTWCLDPFGFEGMYSIFWGQPRVPVEIGVCPTFPFKLIEETEAWRIYRGADGVIMKQFRDNGEFMHSTQFLEYPIKSRGTGRSSEKSGLIRTGPGGIPHTRRGSG